MDFGNGSGLVTMFTVELQSETTGNRRITHWPWCSDYFILFQSGRAQFFNRFTVM